MDSEAIAVRFAELEGRINTQKALMEEARRSFELRLDEGNDFRGEQLRDKALLVNRLEWNSGHVSLQSRMDLEAKSTDDKIGSLIATLYTKLGKEFEARVEERFSAVERRERVTEKIIWVGMGAVSILSVLLRFINISPK